MKKLPVNPSTMIKSLPCSLLAAISLSMITLLFVPTYFSIIGIFFYTLIYFSVYLIFIMPIQILLNRKRLYFLIYISGSFFASALVLLMYERNPFVNLHYYVLAFLAALIIWIFDSLILQERIW
ncbi:UPF0715 family protein [Lederbergia galactosidilytica]|uniref:Uncharacterized protein n=1 Tax=Lederbergia galactosidilytica TaxID=217031 RepID=A0A177ZKP3_9BACI|nr:UPF0715 family protein [Lederbergia galactosidilytica]KRG14680.1 hypothetical protein ACA30_10215 [Virgibacillus soli]OAK68561.1 hypothetical protein ABB05_15965 [Lederbergia galactosidilytica]